MKLALFDYIKSKPLVSAAVTFVALMTVADFINTGKLSLSNLVITTLVAVYFVWGYSQEMKKKK